MIRPARDSDAAALADLYRPIVESTAISFETVAPGEAEMLERVTATAGIYPWLVCEIGGRVVGYAYASRHRVRAAYQWSVESSICVDADYRRLSIGRGLYVSLFGILAAQGYFNVYAGIALPNPASIALHESLGFEALGRFRHVGYKLGAWRDVGWWQLALRQTEAAPHAPLDLPTIRNRPGWEALLARGESHIRATAA